MNNNQQGHALLLYSEDPSLLNILDNNVMSDDMFRNFLQRNGHTVAIFDYWGHNKFLHFDGNNFKTGIEKLNVNLRAANVIGASQHYSVFSIPPLAWGT